MHRVDFALGGGGSLVDLIAYDVEFVGLFEAEVVGQIHVAVVQQALGNVQILALIAVDHRDLAKVERVEEVQRQAQNPKGAGDIRGARGLLPTGWQMHIAQKDQRHGPQRVRRPEQSQEGEDIDERIIKGGQAQGQQGGGQQGSALQAFLELELRLASEEAIADPS